jgi:hypothetical protein
LARKRSGKKIVIFTEIGNSFLSKEELGNIFPFLVRVGKTCSTSGTDLLPKINNNFLNFKMLEGNLYIYLYINHFSLIFL